MRSLPLLQMSLFAALSLSGCKFSDGKGAAQLRSDEGDDAIFSAADAIDGAAAAADAIDPEQVIEPQATLSEADPLPDEADIAPADAASETGLRLDEVDDANSVLAEVGATGGETTAGGAATTGGSTPSPDPAPADLDNGDLATPQSIISDANDAKTAFEGLITAAGLRLGPSGRKFGELVLAAEKLESARSGLVAQFQPLAKKDAKKAAPIAAKIGKVNKALLKVLAQVNNEKYRYKTLGTCVTVNLGSRKIVSASETMMWQGKKQRRTYAYCGGQKRASVASTCNVGVYFFGKKAAEFSAGSTLDPARALDGFLGGNDFYLGNIGDGSSLKRPQPLKTAATLYGGAALTGDGAKAPASCK